MPRRTHESLGELISTVCFMGLGLLAFLMGFGLLMKIRYCARWGFGWLRFCCLWAVSGFVLRGFMMPGGGGDER